MYSPEAYSPETYSPETIVTHVTKRLENYTLTAAPQVLSGGLLNYVWLVPALPKAIVVKQTPPYIASQKDLPLDDSRAVFEARALNYLNTVPWLSETARPPKLLDFDVEHNILIMEAISNAKSFEAWLSSSNTSEVRRVAHILGEFIANLHRYSFGVTAVSNDFQNHTIQDSRYHIHYNNIAELFETVHFEAVTHVQQAVLSPKLKSFGRSLQAKGKCLIMGDLWLSSILIESINDSVNDNTRPNDKSNEDTIRIIDWEFAHYGFPEQDVAHLLAHLWMLGHMSDADVKHKTSLFSSEFTLSYKKYLDDSIDLLFDERSIDNCGVHFGAELMARAVGQFKSSYIYQDLEVDDPKIQEVIEVAKVAILGDMSIFNTLRT